MTVPDEVFSCCCDWGFELAKPRAEKYYWSFKPTTIGWPAPDGSSYTVDLVKRRTSDFVAVYWSNHELEADSARLRVDRLGNLYTAINGFTRKFDDDLVEVWSYSGGGLGSDADALVIDSSFEVYGQHAGLLTPQDDYIYRLNSSGVEQWKTVIKDLWGPVAGGVGAAPATWRLSLNSVAVSADLTRVYTSAFDNTASGGGINGDTYLIELDAADGSLVSSDLISSALESKALVNDSDGNLYLFFLGGSTVDHIKSYDSSLSLNWERPFAAQSQTNFSAVYAMAVDKDKNLIVGGQLTTGSTHWGVKKINTSTQADVWTHTFAASPGFYASDLACDEVGRVYAVLDRGGSPTTSISTDRQINGVDGLLIAGDFENRLRRFCAVMPGAHPHFL